MVGGGELGRGNGKLSSVSDSEVGYRSSFFMARATGDEGKFVSCFVGVVNCAREDDKRVGVLSVGGGGMTSSDSESVITKLPGTLIISLLAVEDGLRGNPSFCSCKKSSASESLESSDSSDDELRRPSSEERCD